MIPASADLPTDAAPLIYLVDDEPLLLDLAEMILAGRGFLFGKFRDPAQAWEVFSKSNPRPALLITDYAMPSMNGIELILKCKSLHPGLKTLLISGTVDETILRDAPVRVNHFLRKPYRTADLGGVVLSLLGKSS